MKKIAVLAGDGIGPEVMQQTLRVLDAVAAKSGFAFEYLFADIGGSAYEKYQSHCPDETIEICKQADAILFGSVGGPIAQQHLDKWKNCEAASILKLRKEFNFNINMRPIHVFSTLTNISPLKDTLIGSGVDILFFRELVGDIYFGKHELLQDHGIKIATDEAIYTEQQIRSIAIAAFTAARARKKKITSVDKANVLSTSKLWREVVSEVSTAFPEIELSHMLVDNCAMQLVLNPQQFDIILTSNLFGDILSDLGAALTGSLGLTPSASINAHGFGLYEPSGGSAPDIAGLGIANPVAQMLSAALMLRHSFHLNQQAEWIEKAIAATLQAGFLTRDLAKTGQNHISTAEFTERVIESFCISH